MNLRRLIFITLCFAPYIAIADEKDSYFLEKWKESESRIYYQVNKYRSVLKEFKDVEQQDSLSVANDLLFIRGKEKKVINLATKSLRRKPSFLGYLIRCTAHLNINRNKKAIWDCTKAIKFNSLSAEAFNNRGVAYQNMGNDKKAILDFKEAINIGYEATKRLRQGIFEN